jgi:hypothetical protein
MVGILRRCCDKPLRIDVSASSRGSRGAEPWSLTFVVRLVGRHARSELDLQTATDQAFASERPHSMSARKLNLLIVFLAVALNSVSAPMAWARMAAGNVYGPGSAMSAMEHCPGNMDAAGSKQQASSTGEHQECCKGGACHCGWLPVAAMSVPVLARAWMAPHLEGFEPIQAFPPKPFEDPLRPPIT